MGMRRAYVINAFYHNTIGTTRTTTIFSRVRYSFPTISTFFAYPMYPFV